MTIALTDEFVAQALNAPGRPERGELIDGLEAGLRLRMGSNVVTWSVTTRSPTGKRIRVSIGNWPDIGVAEARSFANRIKASFAPADPQQEQAFTVHHLFELYRARRLSQLRKGEVIGRTIEAGLSRLMAYEPSEITRRLIAQEIDAVAMRAPIQANRTLAYAKAFFSWAVGRGYLEANPAASITRPVKERVRERTPTLEELAGIWHSAGRLGYPFGPAIQLLILTAARRDEVGNMRVEELDLTGSESVGVWVLPAARSKNGRSIRNPLAPLARSILEDALQRRPDGSRWVFSTTGDRAISGWSKAKQRLDQAIAAARRVADQPPIEPWRLHDLRRAFATAACDLLDVDPAVADRCLNHVGASTTSTVARVYGRSELFLQRKDALTRWAELLQEALAKGSTPSDATSKAVS